MKSRCDSPWDAQTVSPAASCRGSQRLCGGTWCQLSSLQHPLQPWPDPYTTLRRLFHARNRTDSAHGVRKRFSSDYSFGGTQCAQTTQVSSSSAGRRLLPAQSGTILGPGGGSPAHLATCGQYIDNAHLASWPAALRAKTAGRLPPPRKDCWTLAPPPRPPLLWL
jgi:hypothetical protein